MIFWIVRYHRPGDEWPVTHAFHSPDAELAASRARQHVEVVRRHHPTLEVEVVERERQRSGARSG